MKSILYLYNFNPHSLEIATFKAVLSSSLADILYFYINADHLFNIDIDILRCKYFSSICL